MKTILYNFVAVLLFVSAGQSQTVITSSIFSNTIWTKTGSPYLIKNDIVVFEDVMLTIEPGVEVLVDPNIQIELRNGFISARGTQKDSIKFKAPNNSDSKNYWKGFLVKGLVNLNTKIQLDFSYCQLSNADLLFNLSSAHQKNFFDHVLFTKNTFVNDDFSRIAETRIANSVFVNNDRAFRAWGEDKLGYADKCIFKDNKVGSFGGLITNSKYTGHTDYAVYMYKSLINCEIANNNIGVISDNHAYTEVSSNYIHDNVVGVQIDRFWNEASVIFEKNKICNNSTWNVNYMYSNAANLTKNCWCLNTNTSIKSKIRDAYMDISLGIISVSETYTGCDFNQNPLLTISKNLIPDIAFEIYPNPSNGLVTITSSMNIASVQIFDFTGKQVLSDLIGAGKNNLDVSNLNSGVYFVKISMENYSQNKKIVVFNSNH
jgi:hypothetical protein